MYLNEKDIIERNECIISGSSNLEKLYGFRDFPVNQDTTEDGVENDILLDMEFDICADSGMIQLRYLAPENVLYNKDHSRSIGDVWQNHHRKFAGFISIEQPTKVFEIGGGPGYLEYYYTKNSGGGIPWTILEPNPDPVEGCHAVYEVGFFDENYVISKGYDTVVFSHLFEHIYKPDAFVANIARNMGIGDKLIFSVPDMQRMLFNRQTNTLNFEHSFFLAEPYVDYLITKNNFRIKRKEYYMGHSIFYSCERVAKGETKELPDTMYLLNKANFMDFIHDYEEFAAKVTMKMEAIHDRKIYMFGAHLFSQFLLRFGIDERHIEALLDNDRKKQGKRLRGCSLMCESPEILRDEENPIVVIRAGSYQEEIKKGILEINSSTEFWE